MKHLLLVSLLVFTLYGQDGDEASSGDAFEMMLLKLASESFIDEFETLKTQVSENTKSLQNIKDIFYSDDFLGAKKDSKTTDDLLKRELSAVKQERTLLNKEFEELKKSQSALLSKIDSLERSISAKQQIDEEQRKKEELESIRLANELKQLEEQRKIQEQKDIELRKKQQEMEKREAQRKNGIVRDIDVKGFMSFYESKNEDNVAIAEDNTQSNQIEKTIPTTYKIKSDSKIFDKANGKEIGVVKKGSVITSFQKMGEWIKISGKIENGKWVKNSIEQWIKIDNLELKR